MSERLVTLMLGPFVPWFEEVLDLPSSFDFATDELSSIRGVEKPDVGLDPDACCMSLPCSAIRVGASFCSRDRICGVISRRTSSLTGSLDRSEE